VHGVLGDIPVTTTPNAKRCYLVHVKPDAVVLYFLVPFLEGICPPGLSSRCGPVGENGETGPDGANVKTPVGILEVGVCGEAGIVVRVSVRGVVRIWDVDCGVEDWHKALAIGMDFVEEGGEGLEVVCHRVIGPVTVSALVGTKYIFPKRQGNSLIHVIDITPYCFQRNIKVPICLNDALEVRHIRVTPSALMEAKSPILLHRR